MNNSIASVFHVIQRSLVVVAIFGATSIVLAQAAETKGEKSGAKSEVLARSANGVTVTTTDILSEMQRGNPASRQTFLSKPDLVEQVVNNLLMRRTLAKEAERDGLVKDPILISTLQIARDRVLSDARLTKLDAQNEPSAIAIEEQAKNLYQASPTKFEQPAQTRVRHILLPNNGQESLVSAKALLAQLRSGASFEEMAKSKSTDTGSGARGGDLGFFGAGQMVRPFEEAVNALKNPGDLSEPIETQFGYHIIKLEERRAKGTKPFEDVKAQLMIEARTALLNEARVLKAESLNKTFIFDSGAFERFLKSAAGTN